jgi:hypothetical protein
MRSDALERLARAERRKLVDIAITSGAIDKDAFEHMERLSKIAAEAPPARRWLIPIIALALFTVLLALLVKEEHETEIELDVAATEIHFRLPTRQYLTSDQFLRSLSASALGGIEMDGVEWPAPQGSTCSLNVDLVQPAKEEEAITLGALVPPRDWEVGISRTGSNTDIDFAAAPSQLREDFVVRAVLRGKATLRTDCTHDGTYHHVDWTGARPLVMRIGSATTLHCESGLPVHFARQIEFENLRLYTVEHTAIDAAPVDRIRSSLLSGNLYLDALNAKAVSLRPFEDLTFRSSKGYIRVISLPTEAKLVDEGLHLQAHSTVQEMSVGSMTNLRSLMPTWLEVLAAKTGIALLWASVTYGLGVIYAVLRWFEVVT